MRVFVFALLAASLSLAIIADAAEPVVEHSTDASTVVLHYEEVLPVAGEPGPSLTVYGDGRAVVHTPSYQKNAGDVEVRLTPAQMKALIEGMAADGVVEFNPAEARRKLALQRRTRGNTATRSSDPSVTDIQLNLTRYVDADGVEKTNVSKRVRVEGLLERTGDAVPEIRNMGRSQRRARALMDETLGERR